MKPTTISLVADETLTEAVPLAPVADAGVPTPPDPLTLIAPDVILSVVPDIVTTTLLAPVAGEAK
jgi:hypothetical protein